VWYTNKSDLKFYDGKNLAIDIEIGDYKILAKNYAEVGKYEILHLDNTISKIELHSKYLSFVEHIEANEITILMIIKGKRFVFNRTSLYYAPAYKCKTEAYLSRLGGSKSAKNI
jgi:hypothetical protein